MVNGQPITGVGIVVPPTTVVTDFGVAQSVTGLTALFAFTDFTLYDVVLITVVVDATSLNSATFQCDVSQDGSSPDVDHVLVSSVVAAGNQSSFSFGPNDLRKFKRLEVTPASGTAKVKYRVEGRKGQWN